MESPILDNAQEFPAGSDTFFYTNFMQAFEAVSGSGVVAEDIQLRANLTSQLVLPQPSVHTSTQKDVFIEVESCPSRLSLYTCALGENAYVHRILSLFKLSMPASEGLLINMKYRRPETPMLLRVWLHLEGLGVQIPIVEQQETITTELRANEAETLTGILLRVEGHVGATSTSTLLVAGIMSICVRRKSKAARDYTISDATLMELDETSSCLSWRFNNEEWNASLGDNDGLPYSNLTGPFSFFIIEIDGRHVGRAYAMEYVLRGVGDESNVRITGMGFDGEVICVYTGSLRKRQRQGSAESWQLV